MKRRIENGGTINDEGVASTLTIHCLPPIEMPVMDKNLFERKQSEGRRFDGKPKRRKW